jgi:hypothetical protein
MRPICTMCGRRTTPFLFIGLEPVGPTCARNMGLTKTKATKNSRIRFAAYKPRRSDGPQTLDLFDQEGA